MIDNMMLITLFDSLYPCWTREMLVKEGVDMAALERLVEEGLIVPEDGVYSLSETGVAEFRRIALENFIEEKPGEAPADRVRSARAGGFLKLLNAAHLQRWGIKQYYTLPALEIFPKARDEELFAVNKDELAWPYMNGEAELEMEEKFPLIGLRGRGAGMAADAEKAGAWLAEKAGLTEIFTPDILYVCRYDYLQYENFKGHPNDPLRLINTDRFLFVFDSGREEDELREIGRFRRGVMFQRRVMLPGFFDIDTQEQDSICQLLLVSDSEARAKESAARLARFGAQIASGVQPLDIWTLSEEALAAVRDKREIIWELIPDIGHSVSRTTACASCRC